MKILVTGATGVVGSSLKGALARIGHSVRCASRNPDRAAERFPNHTWVAMDVDRPETLPGALSGCEAAFYLVHGMADHDPPGEAERAAAEAFRDAAASAGLKRIVYLGGPVPEGSTSAHLAARRDTGEILRGGSVSTVELRAMIVGPGSASWQLCRDLAVRLPVLVVPSWMDAPSQPIALRDVVTALCHAVEMPADGSVALDLPGPDVLTAREILETIAHLNGGDPISVRTPMMPRRLMEWGARALSRADGRITRQLIEGLGHDLMMDTGFWRRAPQLERTPFRVAARQALQDEGGVGRLRQRVWKRLTSTSVLQGPRARLAASSP